MKAAAWALAALLGGAVAARAEAPATAMRRATSSQLEVTVPPVPLVRDDGQDVTLSALLEGGRPVVLTFIFTKCGTICPVVSQTFAGLQRRLEAHREQAQLVSISIDPEFDTPARLSEYKRRFEAGPRWHFYTGTVEATVAAQRAFEAYRGDKMSHTPVTFLWTGKGQRWERVDGFASPDELEGELHRLLASR